MQGMNSVLSNEVRVRAAQGLPEPAKAAPAESRLEVVWARHADEVRAAQALRWQVFAQEMGARLSPLPGTPAGHDTDLFDAYCEHLIVRTPATAHEAAQVVGTYRVLTPAAAKLVGGLYSDSEFDLVRLRHLRPRMAELGRSCTHAQWRRGGVIMALWGALGPFLQRNGLDCVVGCASVPMHDGGHAAADLWRQLRASHLAPIDLQVRPRLPLPVDQLGQRGKAEMPPLIKGYLRCGAKVLGPPAWDPHFNTADLPLMLRLADLPASHHRRFIATR
jgi:putative hemolysin